MKKFYFKGFFLCVPIFFLNAVVYSQATLKNIDARTTTTYHQFKTSLIAYTTSGLSLTDGNTTVYDSAFSNAVDNDDVTKQSNFGENFAIFRDSFSLALEARMPIPNADTIFFKMWNMKTTAISTAFCGQQY